MSSGDIYKKEIIARNNDQIVYLLGGDEGKIMRAFNDPKTIELMLNPDGSLWHQKLGEKLEIIATIEPVNASSVMNIVADSLGEVLTRANPIIEGEFPLDGSRFSGQIPPVVSAPSFTIRKKAINVFTLQEYVDNNIMTEKQKSTIEEMVSKRKNILVVGGTGTGKTTLANAIIAEMVNVFPEDRIVVIEDTAELQCTAKNLLALRTTEKVNMTQAIKSSLRASPKRIIVGEVRDQAALDVLDAWNTGHEGGICTIHANDAERGVTRLQSMVSRNPFAPKEIEPIIAEVIHCIVSIGHTKERGRKVQEVLTLKGYDKAKKEYIFGENV